LPLNPGRLIFTSGNIFLYTPEFDLLAGVLIARRVVDSSNAKRHITTSYSGGIFSVLSF
jgi:hypothetical protein